MSTSHFLVLAITYTIINRLSSKLLMQCMCKLLLYRGYYNIYAAVIPRNTSLYNVHAVLSLLHLKHTGSMQRAMYSV